VWRDDNVAVEQPRSQNLREDQQSGRVEGDDIGGVTDAPGLSLRTVSALQRLLGSSMIRKSV
jgi:hypothetical protein